MIILKKVHLTSSISLKNTKGPNPLGNITLVIRLLGNLVVLSLVFPFLSQAINCRWLFPVSPQHLVLANFDQMEKKKKERFGELDTDEHIWAFGDKRAGHNVYRGTKLGIMFVGEQKFLPPKWLFGMWIILSWKKKSRPQRLRGKCWPYP